jgi:hypothetical protein
MDRTELLQLALNVASELTKSTDEYWDVENKQGEYEDIYLIQGSKRLLLTLTAYHPALTIHGITPRNERGEWIEWRTYEERKSGLTTSISVTPTKAPARIAGDITRRLLPLYEQALHIVETRIKADTEYETKRQGVAARLFDTFGKTYDRPGLSRSDHFTVAGNGSPSVTFRPSTDSVDFTISNCPLPLAENICALIRGYVTVAEEKRAARANLVGYCEDRLQGVK